MRVPPILKYSLLGSLLMVAIQASAAADPLARLRALGAASQCRQASDCATVPVGLRACGGPAAYIAVGTADEPAAQALAQRHLAQRRAELARSPAPPATCEAILDPGARCVDGRCVTGKSVSAE
ncbi:MAG: hypothetical protein K2X55_17350 [Burkholderiaceae bacterium]|nr:hypothetical protein [Burkholderiaceae bacterium]